MSPISIILGCNSSILIIQLYITATFHLLFQGITQEISTQINCGIQEFLFLNNPLSLFIVMDMFMEIGAINVC